MKSYTDIEQSKILAEILQLESADMHYVTWTILDGEFIVSPNQGSTIEDLQEDYGDQIIPCWSLAALLSVLPIVYINNKKEVCGPLHIDITDSETPFVLWYVNPLHKGCIIELQTKEYDNLVDACVEMILKLKENNKLL